MQLSTQTRVLKPMRSRMSSISSTSSYSSSSSTSLDEDDEDEVNARVSPCWEKYRSILECRGIRLDTFRDVKQYYERNWANNGIAPDLFNTCHKNGYIRACRGPNPDALCKDVGLVSHLFTFLQRHPRRQLKSLNAA